MEHEPTQENQIEQAKEFAAQKFAEAGTGNHYLEVCDILQNEFGITDQDILVAGLLHDTIEDTSATYQEIEEKFGKKVADMVEEVSHPKNYTAEEKKEYYEKIKHISWGGKMIKLADFKSHLPKFIGAFTGKNNLPKFTYIKGGYTEYIRAFLDSCEESEAKETVRTLCDELDGWINRNNTKQ